jgi:predicted amidohydrolase
MATDSRRFLRPTITVTLVQFKADPDDPRRNLQALLADLERHASSDLVVFPELSLHGHALTRDPVEDLRRAARALTGDDYDRLRRRVAELGTTREGGFQNVATYTDGSREINYAKTHVHWTEPYVAGTALPVFPSPLGPTGMLVCYDAAFVEVPRALALNGAHSILNLSAIPDHFPLEIVHRRLVACSVMNQVWTLFANRSGPGFRGGSAVVDPRGAVVAVADETQPHLTVTVDPADVPTWREAEPLLPHRRPQLYANLAAPP